MLHLTRKSGQKIRIGDDIVIQVSSDHAVNFRVSIEAPKEIQILREEIYEKYNRKKENLYE